MIPAAPALAALLSCFIKLVLNDGLPSETMTAMPPMPTEAPTIVTPAAPKAGAPDNPNALVIAGAPAAPVLATPDKTCAIAIASDPRAPTDEAPEIPIVSNVETATLPVTAPDPIPDNV